MPATHVVPANTNTRVYKVIKNGVEQPVHILHRRPGEVYVHYLDTDKRLDEWISEELCTAEDNGSELPPRHQPSEPSTKKRKRRRTTSTAGHEGSSTNGHTNGHASPAGETDGDTLPPAETVLTEEDFDLRQHKQLTSQRNFDTVMFDSWKIKPWYFSPYPTTESEDELPGASSSSQPTSKIPGVVRATARSHGRTSDLLAGGLLRQHVGESKLWVCHFCFKYMVDGTPWELHINNCKVKHPPGKKVYQRGAHTIWEIDGAKEKLYCQNLALFGKLFIDVKTLFFDCDNFMFYILTDAKSSEDHILGFFSKEKMSYDDYNLACIMTLPQYQRMGYGMLMIEFSYELSRRAGKVGTPERPLSDLGLRSYLAFWVSTLIRFFRRVLQVLPPDIISIKNENNFPNLSDESFGDVERMSLKKRKKSKGFDGEVAETNTEAVLCMMPLNSIPDMTFTVRRTFETTPNADGGADTNVKVECELDDVARATNLRVDDAAFALNECGLLMRRMCQDQESDFVVITRALVEEVAKERKVKIMYLDLSCVIP